MPGHAPSPWAWRIALAIIAGLVTGLVVVGGLLVLGHREQPRPVAAASGPSYAMPPTTSPTASDSTPRSSDHGPSTGTGTVSTEEPSPSPSPSPTPIRVVPKPPVLRGVITVLGRVADRTVGGDLTAPVGDCSPDDGYDDIRRGAQVTVHDATGRTIGSGSLLRGYLVNRRTEHQEAIAGVTRAHVYFSGDCQFTFRIATTRVADFYGVEVSHRGVVSFTAREVKRNGGKVALTLG